VPTFPNARYLFGRVEWDHWSAEARGPDDDDILGDSVRPIVDAGLADLVEMDHRLTDEVWLEPTPGHTPGHVSVRIESQGAHAVITGDLMHHPIQCSEPDIRNNFDSDPEAARLTRRAFLGRHADRPVLVLGTHFASPTGGWIRRSGEHWRFEVSGPPEAEG
jgi:glyoxylase-like metal-dependent hydrolase (beta-lactamase superfamily II)